MVRRRLAAGIMAAGLAAVVGLVWTGGSAVRAYAVLVRSDPPANVVLPAAPLRIDLWYDEALNGAASHIAVWNDRHRSLTNGAAALSSDDPSRLGVMLHPLSAGTYRVAWAAVSNQDGQLTRGSFLFTVGRSRLAPATGAAGSGAGAAWDTTSQVPSLLLHWIELSGAVLWIAILFVALLYRSATPERPRLRSASVQRAGAVYLSTLSGLSVTSAGILFLQAHELAGARWNAALPALFAGQYARLWVVREALVLAALALALVDGLGRRGDMGTSSDSEWMNGQDLSLAAGIVYLYLLAASSDLGAASSAATGSSIVSVSIVVAWLHLLDVAAWLAAQWVLLAILRRSHQSRPAGAIASFPDKQLPRLLAAERAAAATLVVSGAALGFMASSSWPAILHSTYGKSLLLELAMVAVATARVERLARQASLLPSVSIPALFRVTNRLALGPRSSWIRIRYLSGPIVLLALTLMSLRPVTADVPPDPVAVAQAPAGALTVTLSLKPGSPGTNVMSVVLKRHGRPVRHARVTVLTSMLDMVMATGLVALREQAPGSYGGIAQLGMGGRWRFDVVVADGSSFTRTSLVVPIHT